MYVRNRKVFTHMLFVFDQGSNGQIESTGALQMMVW